MAPRATTPSFDISHASKPRSACPLALPTGGKKTSCCTCHCSPEAWRYLDTLSYWWVVHQLWLPARGKSVAVYTCAAWGDGVPASCRSRHVNVYVCVRGVRVFHLLSCGINRGRRGHEGKDLQELAVRYKPHLKINKDQAVLGGCAKRTKGFLGCCFLLLSCYCIIFRELCRIFLPHGAHVSLTAINLSTIFFFTFFLFAGINHPIRESVRVCFDL